MKKLWPARSVRGWCAIAKKWRGKSGARIASGRTGASLSRDAALHKAGFANQPVSKNRDDGLRLENVYINATCRCAPPDNRPLPKEISNCRSYFERELEILKPKAILALGKIAWDAYLEILKLRGLISSRGLYKFAHGAEAEVAVGLPRLFGVYHPSQQNTQTGRVTPAMYAAVLRRVRRFLGQD